MANSRDPKYIYLIVLLVAAAVYLGCIVSPPSLQDDVDAVQAQIARPTCSIPEIGRRRGSMAWLIWRKRR